MLWLSHHLPDEYDRCYRVGGLHVCARCAGVYPVLVVTMVAQAVLHAPLEAPLDLPVGLALATPAILDWAFGRFRPHAFSNVWRTATGVLLGLSLGRSLYVHFLKPFPLLLGAQFVLVTCVAVPVILIAYRRSRPR